MALGQAGDRELIVSGSDDTTVRVWEAASGAAVGEALTGHTSRVLAVALGRAGDREVIVSGSDDTTVRVWEIASDTTDDVYDLMAPVTAIALQPSLLGVAAGSSLCTFRIAIDSSAGLPWDECVPEWR